MLYARVPLDRPTVHSRLWVWIGSALKLPALLWFVSSFLLFALAVAGPRLSSGLAWAALSLFVAGTAIAAGKFVRGVAVVVRSLREGSSVPGPTLLATVGNAAMAAFGMLVAYVTTIGFARGRQLRRFGRVLLPGLAPGAAWAPPRPGMDDLQAAPAGLADQWRENGKTEHASVAAFARLTLDLMALGAPPALIAAANRDALDEIRHAELCFSIARGLDARPAGPAPFPAAQRVTTLPASRRLALAKLAVDSLVDGALHEGVSARIIARLAKRCQVAAIRTALLQIAADEGRHSAHGWAVVDWCLEQGGDAVAAALLGALDSLPPQMRSARPVAAEDGDWEAWGIHGRRLESEEYAAALAHVRGRVQAMTGRRQRAA